MGLSAAPQEHNSSSAVLQLPLLQGGSVKPSCAHIHANVVACTGCIKIWWSAQYTSAGTGHSPVRLCLSQSPTTKHQQHQGSQGMCTVSQRAACHAPQPCAHKLQGPSRLDNTLLSAPPPFCPTHSQAQANRAQISRWALGPAYPWGATRAHSK